jgi:hypothetical protein
MLGVVRASEQLRQNEAELLTELIAKELGRSLAIETDEQCYCGSVVGFNESPIRQHWRPTSAQAGTFD